MINERIKLVAPRRMEIFFEDEEITEDSVIVRPRYLSICAADQRYYTGSRSKEILDKKLPLSLIHEAVGEVCSLTWDDIDFENRVINVKHTVYDKSDDGKGRWYMGTTKTKNGVRQIYMSPTLFQALINFKKKQQHLKKLYGSKYITYYFEDVIGKNGKLIERRIIENNGNILHMNIANLVFTRPNGKYVGRNILNYPFKIIHKELGIEDCRFYDLRGSYATTNLRNGVEIRDVADILGHKYVETTENFYISSTEEDKKDVTTAFDKVMTSDLINDIIKYEIAY